MMKPQTTSLLSHATRWNTVQLNTIKGHDLQEQLQTSLPLKSMHVLSRRSVVSVLPWAILSSTSCPKHKLHDTTISTTSSSSSAATTIQLAEWICLYTPKSFRKAVQETRNFLYRGADNDVEGGSYYLLQQPEPDLLLPETYGNDPSAVKYFECLEARLGRSNNRPFQAKPSNGHIATSDPTEAAKWGDIVSVWPLGGRTDDDEWSYVWPRDRNVFYPKQNGGEECLSDTLVVNVGLEEALRMKSREVLFATATNSGGVGRSTTTTTAPSSVSRRHTQTAGDCSILGATKPSSFLAISSSHDAELLRELDAKGFGLLE